MCKAPTRKQLQELDSLIHSTVYEPALGLVTVLDKNRDVIAELQSKCEDVASDATWFDANLSRYGLTIEDVFYNA